MKRIVVIVAILAFAVPLAFAGELSPSPNHVRLSEVPRQCLETGSAEKDGATYTCKKVEGSEVWNELELRKFEKEVFEAYKQASAKPIGLVVRQDWTETAQQPTTFENNKVAVVERRDGYKYRYSRR